MSEGGFNLDTRTRRGYRGRIQLSQNKSDSDLTTITNIRTPNRLGCLGELISDALDILLELRNALCCCLGNGGHASLKNSGMQKSGCDADAHAIETKEPRLHSVDEVEAAVNSMSNEADPSRELEARLAALKPTKISKYELDIHLHTPILTLHLGRERSHDDEVSLARQRRVRAVDQQTNEAMQVEAYLASGDWLGESKLSLPSAPTTKPVPPRRATMADYSSVEVQMYTPPAADRSVKEEEELIRRMTEELKVESSQARQADGQVDAMRARLEKLKGVKVSPANRPTSKGPEEESRAQPKSKPLGPPPLLDPYEFELAASGSESEESESSESKGSSDSGSEKRDG